MHYTDVTVYALYKSLATLTVDKNGGSSNQEFEEKYPTGTIIELEDLTKTGYVFTGWEVVSGNSTLSGKRITIGSTDTTIKGTFTLGSYICSAGKYLKAGETSCTTCPEGSYCPGGTYPYNEDEDQGINSCPSEMTSIAGSSLITHCKITCAAGTYLKANGTSCTDCPANSYCSGGTYNYNPNEDQGINSCPGSMTSNAKSSLITHCKITCTAGTYLKKNGIACTNCLAGSYCPSKTCNYSTSEDCGITACAKGYYSAANATTCIACTNGSYQANTGSSSCTACDGGKTTNNTGTTASTSCTACPKSANVASWETQTWNTNNTVVPLCKPKTCNNGYVLSGDECVLDQTATKVIIAKLGTCGLYKDEHGDYRYAGNNSSVCNYVTFNNETWRIVGVFNTQNTVGGDTKLRVKLVRNTLLGEYSWDTSDSGVNNGYGINQWAPSGSYAGADLMRELNGDYLNTSLSADTTWYNGQNNTKTGVFYKSNVLNSTSQSLIDSVVWYTGALVNGQHSAAQVYSAERGSTTCQASGATGCDFTRYSVTTNDGVKRTTNWTGKVALLYPSDYAYASNNCHADSTKHVEYIQDSTNGYNSTLCRNSNWLYENNFFWFLTPTPSRAYLVWDVYTEGDVNNTSAYNHSGGVKPSLYLKTNVKIISGEGTSSNPYKLSI